MYNPSATIGDTTNGGVPNITGSFITGKDSQYRARITNASGAFFASGSGTTRDIDGGSSTSSYILNLSAARSSAVYDAGRTVRPAGVYMNWCVKY